MAWISACLCYCRGGEYFNDDDCKLDWILRRIGWHHGLVKGDFGELLRYDSLLGAKLTLGLAFVAAVFAALFIAVQVMFEIREDEKRRGITLRC